MTRNTKHQILAKVFSCPFDLKGEEALQVVKTTTKIWPDTCLAFSIYS